VLYDRPVYQSEDLKRFLYWMPKEGNIREGKSSKAAEAAIKTGQWYVSEELGADKTSEKCLAFMDDQAESPDQISTTEHHWKVRKAKRGDAEFQDSLRTVLVLKLAKPQREGTGSHINTPSDLSREVPLMQGHTPNTPGAQTPFLAVEDVRDRGTARTLEMSGRG